MSWQPSASLSTLQARAEVYRAIRQFFFERNILEVDTPILSEFATVDPFIESLCVHSVDGQLDEQKAQAKGSTRYLQTSPEFFLKRLVSAYHCDTYSLGKAFRQGEQGCRHHPEFTLLEWYRVGWDEHQLMAELEQLVRLFFPDLPVVYFSYRQAFQQVLSIDPHVATVAELEQCANQRIEVGFTSTQRTSWLDLLMTHCIEPALADGLVFVYDYPADQAALARVEQDEYGQAVARRFELYLNGIELANGYWELTDAGEQEARFAADQQYRQQHHLPSLPYDKQLVDALRSGLPSCAGVAVGVDRLLMCYLGVMSIQQVMSFP